MAYISKSEVQSKSAKLKSLNKAFKEKGYLIKSSFSGSNSSGLTLTIQSSSIDFVENHIITVKDKWESTEESIINMRNNRYIQVNHYYLSEWFSGVALEYLQKAYSIMLDGHFDESDSMTDYFHCSWYNHIQIGKWDKPFILLGE